MSGTDVDLTTLLEETMEIAIQRADGPTYGRVNSYDSAKERVSVTPLVPKLTAGQVEVHATLTSVPVEWSRSTTHSIKFPLSAGAIVRLHPMGHDHSEWLTSGSEGIPPKSERRFSLSDLVAIPVSPTPYSQTASALAYDSAWGVLFGQWAAGGSDATKAVALHADAVNKDASAPAADFASWMAAVEAGIAAAGGGAISPAAATITKIGTVVATSTKLKAK